MPYYNNYLPQDPYAARASYTPPNGYNYASPVIFGRYINDISEVTAQDVPMDGSVSFFPSRDGMSIFAKTWNADGTIKTMKYILDDGSVRPTEDISSRLDSMEQRIKRLEYRKPYNQQNKHYRKPEEEVSERAES